MGVSGHLYAQSWEHHRLGEMRCITDHRDPIDRAAGTRLHEWKAGSRPDQDALWVVLRRPCPRCYGTGKKADPGMGGPKFYEGLACMECREEGPQTIGRGWLYPLQPGWWEQEWGEPLTEAASAEKAWRWFCKLNWRAMGLYGEN